MQNALLECNEKNNGNFTGTSLRATERSATDTLRCHYEPERSEWCGNPMTAYSLAPCGGCKGNHRAGRDVCDPACGGKAAEEGWGEGAYKKCAFTLAEVLLTIGILGVVAAMTIPTLMQNSQNKELVSHYLKMNNILSNALK
ncbi:type II secretion system protein, partial [bacterium]|nr:type II secretion system protein [bacterium]